MQPGWPSCSCLSLHLALLLLRERLACQPWDVSHHFLIAVQDTRLGGCSGPESSGNALQSYCSVGTAACWGPSREAQQVRGADMAAASRWLSAATGSWHLERCIGQSFWPSPWCTVMLMCLQDTILSAQHWCMCQFALHAVLTNLFWGLAGAFLLPLCGAAYSALAHQGAACPTCGGGAPFTAWQVQRAVRVLLKALFLLSSGGLLCLCCYLLCSPCGAPCSALAGCHSLLRP